MTQSNPLSLQLRSDGRLLAAGPHQPRTLLFDLTCADAPSATPAAPIAVVLAVDVSGSMNGPKLEAVREAAARMAAGLSDGDLLGLCAFEETAQVLLPITAMNGEGRSAAAAVIQSLQSGGSTALCAGWRLAAEELAREDARFLGRSLHVVVLSDGQGNQGETNPSALAEYASCMALRGISTSAIGVGDDWSTDQLEALAVPGGGRLHHAIHADEITALLDGEVRGMQRLSAIGLELALALPEGFEAQILAPEQARLDGAELRIRLGAMARGGHRTLAVGVCRTPAAGPGPWVFEATLSAQDPSTREPLPPLHVAVRLDPAADPEAARAARDLAAAREVAEHWLADATRRVMNANRDGEADTQALAAEAKRFADYCRGVDGTEALVSAMSRLVEQANREWAESDRKLVQMAAFKQSRSEGVHANRACFITTLNESLDGRKKKK